MRKNVVINKFVINGIYFKNQNKQTKNKPKKKKKKKKTPFMLALWESNALLWIILDIVLKTYFA